MTGLDRLHGIAEDVGRTVWLRDLGAALSETADAIEGETSGPSGYESDVLAWVEKNGGLEAVKERTMPEDMSWPFYEDGEPVRIGEYVICDERCSPAAVDCIEFNESGFKLYGESGHLIAGSDMPYGERVKRQAPPVIDADGVEIRVGDTVYGFAGQQYEVTGLCEYESSIVHAKTVGDGVAADELLALSGQLNSAQLEASKITHRAPVLAADGEPLEVGQTVYHIADGKEYTVEELFEDGAMVTPDGITGGRCRADYLTHERPDSWERLEEDAEEDPCGYFGFDGEETCGKCPASGKNCEQTMARDLVRRARALAGVSE